MVDEDLDECVNADSTACAWMANNRAKNSKACNDWITGKTQDARQELKYCTTLVIPGPDIS